MTSYEFWKNAWALTKKIVTIPPKVALNIANKALVGTKNLALIGAKYIKGFIGRIPVFVIHMKDETILLIFDKKSSHNIKLEQELEKLRTEVERNQLENEGNRKLKIKTAAMTAANEALVIENERLENENADGAAIIRNLRIQLEEQEEDENADEPLEILNVIAINADAPELNEIGLENFAEMDEADINNLEELNIGFMP